MKAVLDNIGIELVAVMSTLPPNGDHNRADAWKKYQKPKKAHDDLIGLLAELA